MQLITCLFPTQARYVDRHVGRRESKAGEPVGRTVEADRRRHGLPMCTAVLRRASASATAQTQITLAEVRRSCQTLKPAPGTL